MSDFNVTLHPSLVNMGTEGSMDSSVLNGKSVQRTLNNIIVPNGENRKLVGQVSDGNTFDDVIATSTQTDGITPGLSSVYIFINNNYVDYVTNPDNSNHEANNLIAYLEQQGIQYATFTEMTADFINTVPRTATLVIPELEVNNLAPDLSNNTRNAIFDFVNNGGKLLLFDPSSGDPLSVLNDVFSFSLLDNGATQPIDLTVDGGSLFGSEASTLPDHSATGSIDTTTLPIGSTIIYEGNGSNESVVTKIAVGDGNIYVLGWDWYDAAPLGNQDGGWLHLLQSILDS